MNCSPTLTAKEFSAIHNAKCELHRIFESMEGVVHPKLQERFEKALAQINEGLKGAYKQDDATFKKNSDHYDAVSAEKNFYTNWSIYEVPDLFQQHPFVGAKAVLYKDHWGSGVNDLIQLEGNTWVDLWEAADKAIRQSGDDHHVFIESFHPSKDDPSVLELGTGS